MSSPVIRQVFGVRVSAYALFSYFVHTDAEFYDMFTATIGYDVPLPELDAVIATRYEYISGEAQSDLFDEIENSLTDMDNALFPNTGLFCHRFSEERGLNCDYIVGTVLQTLILDTSNTAASSTILALALIPVRIVETTLMMDKIPFFAGQEQGAWWINDRMLIAPE